jgi:hypothetical protein
MKPSVAITLIIVGAALIAVPPLVTAWQAYVAAQALIHGGILGIGIGDIGDLYRFACWLPGIAMIFVGIRYSLPPFSVAHLGRPSASVG